MTGREPAPHEREELVSGSAADTERAGARLARRLEPGDVVLVGGELGSGKTTFVRGACRELGFDGPVTSPTFTIGQRYEGRLSIAHLDLYRLEGLAGEDPALLDDYLTPCSIGFVEWPARGPELEGLLADGARIAASVRLEHAGNGERRISIDWRAGEGRGASP